MGVGRVVLRKAVSLYEELVPDCERLLGAAHPAALSARNNLASAYWAAGQAASVRHAIGLQMLRSTPSIFMP